MHWYDDASKIRGFGEVLLAAGFLEEVEEFQEFLSKPFKWDGTYEIWEELEFPDEQSRNWQEFLDSITEVDEDESDDDSNSESEEDE